MSEFLGENTSLDYQDIRMRIRDCLSNDDIASAEKVIDDLAVEAESAAQLAISVDDLETEKLIMAISRGNLGRILEISTLLEGIVEDSELAEKRLEFGRLMLAMSSNGHSE